MKYLIPFLIAICILPIAFGAIIDAPRIGVKTAFTDPYPVEPGKSFTLSLKVINNGSDVAENVVIELNPIFPFTLGEEAKKSIENVNIGDTRIVDYNMFVDSSAVSATYELPVYITYGSYHRIETTVQIRVQGKPNFKLIDVKIGTISPGDMETVKVNLNNVGSGKAKRTTVTFSSDSTYIKPILSGGNVYIGDFLPDQTQTVEFKILASPDAEYDVYTGYVNISYEDESGSAYNKKFDVGVLISGEPKLQIFKTEVDETKGEISVELVNIGTAEAKGISAKLLIDDKIFDADYITSIKMDKRSTVKFNLPNKMNGKLELSYKGPDNKEYKQTEDIGWTMKPKSQTWVLGVIALVIVVYIFWKKKWLKKIF
jgi:hypothetical protein